MNSAYSGINWTFPFFLLIAIAALSGCQAIVNKGPIRSVEWQSSVAGWTVVCGDHELLVDPLCRISRGTLVYTIQALPAQLREPLFATETLTVGTNHHPGTIVFIRRGSEVADGYEPSIYSDKAKPILMAGGEVLARWTAWPSAGRSQTVRVDGFAEAHAAAMDHVKRMAGESASLIKGN